MLVEFDNIKVEVRNEVSQRLIKNYILKATDQSHMNKAWTQDDDSRLKEMVGFGAKPRQIAKELKRTAAAVNQRKGKLGLRPQRETTSFQI